DEAGGDEEGCGEAGVVEQGEGVLVVGARAVVEAEHEGPSQLGRGLAAPTLAALALAAPPLLEAEHLEFAARAQGGEQREVAAEGGGGDAVAAIAVGRGGGNGVVLEDESGHQRTCCQAVWPRSKRNRKKPQRKAAFMARKKYSPPARRERCAPGTPAQLAKAKPYIPNCTASSVRYPSRGHSAMLQSSAATRRNGTHQRSSLCEMKAQRVKPSKRVRSNARSDRKLPTASRARRRNSPATFAAGTSVAQASGSYSTRYPAWRACIGIRKSSIQVVGCRAGKQILRSA